MTDLPDRALSVRAPWWWAIIHAGKDIENRSRKHSVRGRVWLHASAWHRPTDIAIDIASMADCYDCAPWPMADARHKSVQRFNVDKIQAIAEMRAAGGHIVGSVEIVDCVTESESPWYFGPVGFVLRNPIALPKPVPCKGALSFFRVPADVLERLAA